MFVLLVAFMLFYEGIAADNPYKLPRTVRPHHYRLHLTPDIYNKTPENFVLTGSVIIYANVTSKTGSVHLHSFGLNISTVSVLRNGRNLFKDMNYDDEKQWFVISLEENLDAGDKIKIEIRNFERPILHNFVGLYYYSRRYKKRKRYGVLTQLQSVFARYMFPCFDEPALKATFSISIRRKKPFFAISNEPVERQVDDDNSGWITDYFKTTPSMSTYLVAAIVTQYKGYSVMHRKVNFTIYHPTEIKDYIIKTDMNISLKCFDHLEEYFDVKFPISKLDQIGFSPRDYQWGGMENYGMITYIDLAIYSPLRSMTQKTISAGTILHELTHQWFGNLVTMKWWDDLWLNEGMTEFFSFLRGKWLKEYKLKEEGNLAVMESMKFELSSKTYPVYVPWAKDPMKIESLVNSVTYRKGGMIVKMAELLMGESVFKEAMRHYVKQNKYGVVTHNSLFESFTTANKKYGKNLEVRKVIIPWLKQPGYPVVNVTINHEAGIIQFEQHVFYKTAAEFDSVMPRPSEYKYVWPIPIQWKSGKNGLSPIVVRHEKRGTIQMNERLSPLDWLILNPECNFYYIVNYEKLYWRNLGRHLSSNFSSFDEITRAKIIFDVAMLYRATTSGKGNYIDATTVNEVLSFVERDDAYLTRKVRKMVFKDLKLDKALKQWLLYF